MALEKEQEFFEAHRAEWMKYHENKFALVVGDELTGMYDTPQAAYEAGVDRFGNVPMLIKQVLTTDPVILIPALTLGLIDANL